ncbi:MAG TPA: hypothetical protein VK864_10870, partial [Longimicrobiales bacterium]|nr:hypothetical protein [Longimicrobiales bacterium]
NLRGSARSPGRDLRAVIWAPRRTPPTNRGISEVEIGGGLAPRAGERSTAAVRISGSGTDSVNIRLLLRGRTAAAGIAAPGASAVLPLPPQQPGPVSGWAEIDADAMRADDRRYFAVQIAPIPAVALGRTVPFVDDAINVLADARRVQRASLSAADVLLAPAGMGLESARPDASVIVLPPESPVEIPAANRRLASAGIAWRYAVASAVGEARFAAEAANQDPLLRHLAGVQIRQLFQLQAPAGRDADSVMLRLSDGSPWAVRGQRASGSRFVLLASPLSTEASTLPTSPAMVPLLDRLFGAWTATALVAADVPPGQPVALPAEATLVRRPDNASDTLSAGDTYRAPAEPGTYRAYDASGREVASFVINPSPVESDLTVAEPRRIRNTFEGWRLEFADDAGEWLRDIYQHRLGRELWWPIVLALLLLLIAESIVAATGRATRAPAVGGTPEPRPAESAPARFSS